MALQCNLCPKGCVIESGQSGECRIRINVNGKLIASTYGHPCSVHIDPIEKKPLYHFLPGTGIFSLATVGCNLHCKNCQNWEISQENPENVRAHKLMPEEVSRLAQKYGCLSIAYTYTEPLVYYEYTLDCSIQSHAAGLKNVIVTAGYLNRLPLKRLYEYVDGANIDIKAMTDQFYREICDASLKPVLDACVLAREMGVWVEITNLVIPTLNDSDEDFRRLAQWIRANLGPETPLHFSRFFPQYQMQHLPPTPSDTLNRAKAIATSEGLSHVYLGNISLPEGENTRCPACGKIVIERRGYTVLTNTLQGGQCTCGKILAGVWK